MSKPSRKRQESLQVPSRIICCGLLVADLKFSTDHFPGKDEKVFANNFDFIPGGPATNAALTIQQLGGDAQLLATCGSCSLSDSLVATLVENGVHTDEILRAHNGLNIAAIISDTNGERRAISYKKEVSYQAPKDLEPPNTILVDGHQAQASLELLERFPSATSILDAGSVHEGTELLYDKVDWLITSHKYALNKTNETCAQRALTQLAQLNENVVITLGEQGCLYSYHGEVGEIPGIKIQCADSNGAGDVFHGAFVYSLSSGTSYLESLHFANQVAAESCQHQGIIGKVNLPR
jgi:sulfofructose kinase